jgi:hypothetical protein
MAGLVACSNLSEKRTLLAAAGFKTIPATTPAQLAKLNSLKSGKVVPLVGKKGTVYVFADTARKTLLAGNASQYEAYRKLKVSQQKIDEKLLDAQVNMDNTDYNTWGPNSYENWGWGVASDPL